MAKLLDLSVYGPGHISNILQVDASVYAKAFVTDGGKDTQVVRGDGTLASISSLYVGNAATASSAPWSGITGKPTTFTPSAHTHTASDITGLPTSLKNPYKLTFGSKTYDGSATATITASDLGALTSITKSMVEGVLTGNITSHTHSQYLTSALIPAKLFVRKEMFPRGYFIIKINNNSEWILSFDVKIVVRDGSYTIRFSEDNSTKSESWYRPSASMIDGEDSIEVKFGYSRTNKWVAIPSPDSLVGISITNVANGYASVDTYDLDKLFTINFFGGDASDLKYLGTVQETITIYPPSKEGHTHTFASLTSKPTTINGYGITDALTTSNYNSYVPTRTGTGASGTWGINISGNAATATNAPWSGITGKPTTFTPSAHTHTASDITGLPTKLSAFTNDVGYITGITKSMVEGVLTGNITSHTHSYLPLSGGTLTGPIIIKKAITDEHWGAMTIKYNGSWSAHTNYIAGINVEDSTGIVGRFGVTYDGSYGKFIVRGLYNSAYDKSGEVFSVNAVGDVTATKFIGSLSGNAATATNADKLDGYHKDEILRETINPASVTSLNAVVAAGIDFTSWDYASSANINNQPKGDGAASAASVVSFGTHYPFQIYSDYSNTSYLYYRSYYSGSGGWKAWRRFAFIDSNVASATKLQTPRTIWGQSFDGSGNVSGEAIIGQVLIGRNGNVIDGWYGNNAIDLFLNFNSTKNVIACYNGGNVIIGNATSAGYKLQVNGSANATTLYENGTRVALSGHTHPYLPLSGGTMTGAITMNTGTGLSMKYTASSTTGDRWIYPTGADSYGIRYFEGDPDKMTISATGNNTTIAGADLCINGNGSGTVTIRGNTIYHTGNLTKVSQLTNDAGYKTTDTNTWRPVTNTYTGSDQSTCVSQYGTNALYNALVNGYASSAGTSTYASRLGDSNSYYTKSSLDTALNGKANSSHGTHVSGTSFSSGNSGAAEHNCNSITSNGHWYYNSNGPSGLGENSTDGALYSQAYSDDWVGQIAQDYRNGNLFTRGKRSGTWTAWKAVSYNGHTHKYAGSSSAGGAATSVVVTDSNANSTYRMVWHSGNSLYSTNNIYCNPSTDSIYASAFYETSDERLKDFENSVNVDLNLIRSIPKMYFRWKKNPNKLQIGTSAQAVKQIYPELVSSTEDGILSVDYSKLSIVALSAIDKLHLENQGLKHEINLLKQEIEKLKGQI